MESEAATLKQCSLDNGPFYLLPITPVLSGKKRHVTTLCNSENGKSEKVTIFNFLHLLTDCSRPQYNHNPVTVNTPLDTGYWNKLTLDMDTIRREYNRSELIENVFIVGVSWRFIKIHSFSDPLIMSNFSPIDGSI